MSTESLNKSCDMLHLQCKPALASPTHIHIHAVINNYSTVPPTLNVDNMTISSLSHLTYMH